MAVAALHPSEADAAAPADAAPPAGPDPLLQALVHLTACHGRERSAESLLAGMPVEERLAPDEAVRLLQAAGYSAGIIERRLVDIHALLLPVVLLLQDRRTCVLLSRDTATGLCEIAMPWDGVARRSVATAELDAIYAGFALAAAPQGASAAEDPAERGPWQAPTGHWLWGTLRRFVPYYRSALLAALLSNLLMLVTGLVMAVSYDKVIPHQAFTTLWTLATGAVVALCFDLTARQLRAHLIDLAGRKTDLLLGSMLFRQTLDVRMEHRPQSAGSYAHHIAQIELVREFFASATLAALSDLPFIAIFLAMIFLTAGVLGWVLLLAIPLILGFAFVIQKSLRRTMSRNMEHKADLHGVLVEAVEGLEDLKAAGAQGRFLRRYEGATEAAALSSLKARAMSSWTVNLSAGAQQLVTLVMLVWGVYLIHDGHLTGGALIGAIMYANRAVQPLGSVVSLATRYQAARAAMAALDEMMKLPREREAGRQYVARHQVSGRVALHEASFAYPAAGPEAAPQVLRGVHLRFAPGERVAILGRIGSGKSTILRLLAGLYQPTDGRVEVDGIDLRQIDPAEFRARVGFVSQEPRLFTGTLRDNVVLGRPGIDAARLVGVAALTGLDRLVAAHPQGWELPVGEMGGMLSGGQRQLVALARCLATEPQILLMDEPTSSMDAQSEVAFLRQLKDAAGQRTLVMVTHRPAVLELVDRIVVVDAGKVVLDGPKAQVLAALSGNTARPAAVEPAASNLLRHPAAPAVRQAANV